MTEQVARDRDNGARALLAEARALSGAGRVREAEQRCTAALKLESKNAGALAVLGTLRERQNDLEAALQLLATSLEYDPRQSSALHGLGRVLRRLGRRQEAVAAYGSAIAIATDDALAFYQRGNVQRELRLEELALADFERAISLRPDFAPAYFGRALVLQTLERLHDALESYDRAIELVPKHLQAHHNRGNVLVRLNRHEDAIESYDNAIRLDPRCAEAHVNCSAALRSCRRYGEALASCETALALNPRLADAHNARGLALEALRRPTEAIESYDRAVASNPSHVDAHVNRGRTMREQGAYGAAIASYDKALILRPRDPAIHHGRCVVLLELGRFDEALDAVRNLLDLDPRFPCALGLQLETMQRICDWDGLDLVRNALREGVERGSHCAAPFSLLASDTSAATRRRCAEIHIARKYPPVPYVSAPRRSGAHDRIHVAYLSADFRSHATATLATAMFEQHDRTRFKTVALSFGADDRSVMRARLEKTFDQFIDVREMDDEAVAGLMRSLEIDIAIDLMGFTRGCRTGIFALRPAPIQVNYLGFPGTMGAPYIDYLIADRIVIPDAHRKDYAEQIAYLPETYQCTDAKRRIGAPPCRQELGLPESGLVFCSFNGTFKLTPEMFDAWMRLLSRTEGSVLWLLQSNVVAADNLKREAEARGIAAGRLIFAPVAPYAEHLARLTAADLFLDTLPCGAHTTASDALWAGVPVVTCVGEVFSSRVAASLLNAVGLPDLATRSLEEYEDLAFTLAHDPSALAAVKDRLMRNRETYPLFDTARFTRHLEAAYAEMAERHRRGESPASFAVHALDAQVIL
jgi:protein O-GlcNAc transferase